MTIAIVNRTIRKRLEGSPFIVDEHDLGLSICDPRHPINWVADICEVFPGEFVVKSWNSDLIQGEPESMVKALKRLRKITLFQDEMSVGLSSDPQNHIEPQAGQCLGVS
ncbi:MAG: hypothetical protein ABJ370_06750 [Paracoccaceae bacterium]